MTIFNTIHKKQKKKNNIKKHTKINKLIYQVLNHKK